MFYLQDFDRVTVHPPYVGVEDEKISSFPVGPMLGNGFGHYDSLRDAMVSRVIRIGLYQKWSPVEFNRRIVILHIILANELLKNNFSFFFFSCVQEILLLVKLNFQLCCEYDNIS